VIAAGVVNVATDMFIYEELPIPMAPVRAPPVSRPVPVPPQAPALNNVGYPHEVFVVSCSSAATHKLSGALTHTIMIGPEEFLFRCDERGRALVKRDTPDFVGYNQTEMAFAVEEDSSFEIRSKFVSGAVLVSLQGTGCTRLTTAPNIGDYRCVVSTTTGFVNGSVNLIKEDVKALQSTAPSVRLNFRRRPAP